ncbi:MAG: pilus assembly protein [Rhizobiales bacterium]|nr:pilus assembly protein [Hyphomicrobiales bacterium]
MRDDRGGPLVEMAVVLLPFLVIFGVLIEGGNLLWRHQIALKAVREMTRYVSRAPLLFDDACALDDTVLFLTSETTKILGVTGLLNGGSALIPGWSPDDIDVPTPVVLRVDPCLALVQVIADVNLPLPFAPLFRIFNPEQGDSITFSIADQARWLGE